MTLFTKTVICWTVGLALLAAGIYDAKHPKALTAAAPQQESPKELSFDRYDVIYKCKKAANDSAKYGDPEWPWLSFNNVVRGVDDKAVTAEYGARFSNGFGAMRHVTVRCIYDIRSRTADVDISLQ